MIDKNEKLLPCPFCGSNDLEIVPDLAEDDNNRIYAYHVFCKDCYARGRNLYPHCWCESEQQAIEAWNNRFIPAMIPDEVDDNRVQLSTDALFIIRRELMNSENIIKHINDLLTPIQMVSKKEKK
ncbi:MAG: Lar family restriction alleviation protein [Candidatus Paceibacterota bacterium]|jgi:Lar family restriction alleviation protein